MAIPVYKTIDKCIGIPLAHAIGAVIKMGRHASPSLPDNPKRILIIKLWAIGDSLVMLPMIKALSKRFPNAAIDVLCRNRNKEVFECIEGISDIHLFEWGTGHMSKLASLRRRYDLVIDGEPYLRLSALLSFYLGTARIGWGGFARSKLYTHPVDFSRSRHMVHNYLSMAKLVGANLVVSELIKPKISDMDRRHVTMAFESRGIAPGEFLVAASPGVAESSKSRQWMPDRFAQALDDIAKKQGAKILFFGSRGDLASINEVRNRMKSESITLAGQLSLAQTCEALSRCSFALSVDTGPMHAAAAVGIPTIGLFGPNIPTLWAPFGPQNKAIYHAVECSPCIINEKGQMPDCLRKTDKYLCMKKITVGEVVQAAQDVHERRYSSMLHPKHSDQNTGS